MVTKHDDYQVAMAIYDEADAALGSLFILHECLSLLQLEPVCDLSQQARFAVEVLGLFIPVLEKRLESVVRDSCSLVQNATYE